MRTGDRAQALRRLNAGEQWDVLVIGGGITGAGVLREAARRGLKAALVEQRDFAWGTSSRSSKMVHGGLRYLGEGQVGLARKAVRERDRLIAEAPGLVERVEVIYPLHRHKFPGRIAFGAVLTAYDVLGRRRRHAYLGRDELLARAPGLAPDGLRGAYVYTDGATDDARLVQRVIGEAVADGAVAVNYARVSGLLRTGARVTGVEFVDEAELGARSCQLTAAVVVDASGVWADALEPAAFGELRIRPLRGSHLVIGRDRLAIDDTVIFMHPADGRPVFAYPWQDRMVIGTTDLDHTGDLNDEASVTADEVDYLISAVKGQFGVNIGRGEVISTWSGVRPVLSAGGDKRPSKEKRDEAVWAGAGIVCASGGKLTTFRLTALKVLAAAAPFLPEPGAAPDSGIVANSAAIDGAVFAHKAPADAAKALDPVRRRALAGRLGAGLADFDELPGYDEPPIEGTGYSLAELRYAARHEMVVHLDDMLLRRTRLGNVLPLGGHDLLLWVEPICREELGWDEARWQQERHRYERIWRQHYSMPPEPVKG